MEHPRVFTKSSKVIQRFIINIGSAMFEQLGLDKINDDEVIMKFNSTDNKNLKHFYPHLHFTLFHQHNPHFNSLSFYYYFNSIFIPSSF